MSSPDPFATLERMLQKYKRDVHQLAGPASPDALAALEAHLGRRLPTGLRALLSRHNGGELFRGALRLRSTSEVALASETARNVWLIADGHEGALWAAGRNHDGEFAFGVWRETELQPLHASFFGWFDATLEVLDARVGREEDRAAIRLESDPDDPFQLYGAGLRALHAGRPEEAVPLFDRATRADPGHVLAWQRLGDALTATDRAASRRAWLMALQHTRLPLPWPGAPLVDVELFPSLARTYHDPEEWEHELERFLQERVHEVRTAAEFEVVVAACTALADSLVRRGRRLAARDALAGLLTRSTLFEVRLVPWTALLALVAVEIDLGHHDEAEKHVRQVRLEGPRELQGEALLQLGRLVVMREEPWAEEILDDALSAATSDDARLQIALLRVERAARQNRRDEARGWLEIARKLVDQGAPRLLRAWTALAEGDVARLTNDAGEVEHARQAWRHALDILADRPAPEIRQRIEIRLGDQALTEGDVAEAQVRYRAAANAFAAQELPVREAWALVRLARVMPDPGAVLGAARSRFLESDLAAGVAVVDALSGDPSTSLSWHLERATEHARARYNAERSRPPWRRSDAERPERRLGAHRMAIAACNEIVVRALAVEMEASARAIRSGRGRPLDPPVLRYTAAVDLLAGHRSYDAAQVLMTDLVEERVDGIARRALQGAIARSPNAALVDGLLGCIERPTGVPAPAVAAAAEVLGLRREAEALTALTRLASPGSSPLVRKAAITALGRIGRRELVDRIAPGLEEPSLAEATALALLMLGDRRGIDFHARALSEHRKDLSGHPGEIVGRYGGPSHLLVLLPAATQGEDDVALGAIQGLGLMGDARAIPTLLKALDPHDPRKVEVANGALQILTGHAEDPEQPGLQRRWSLWWEANAARFPTGVRHRDGRLFDVGLLLERMDNNDPWVRRTAYDELVITSGHRLPFDSDGPWRVQIGHLKGWRQWWAASRARLPAGRWFLDGRAID
jgi:tetratricopeptide (TPR) repeat protein